jgi:hypothetical protein
MDVHLWKTEGLLIMRGEGKNWALTITVEIGCVNPFSEDKYLQCAHLTHRYMNY